MTYRLARPLYCFFSHAFIQKLSIPTISLFSAPLSLVSILFTTDGIAGLAFPLPGASTLAFAEREVRDVDLRDGDRHQILAFSSDELSLRDVLSQVLTDLTAHDRAEAGMILVY